MRNLLCCVVLLLFFRDKSQSIVGIGFWNLENLYDTINDPFHNDDDFTPSGNYGWTGERYRRKLQHLSEAIAKMGTELTPDGLAIIGFCETENRSVVEALVKMPLLSSRHYSVILIEGPDARGVDPALIFQPRYFMPSQTRSVHVKLVTDSTHKTRDILLVRGKLLDTELLILVNHWPSRRGGELASLPNRIAAAKVVKRIVDSVTISEPTLRILIMGDLNDDPVSPSVKKILKTRSDPSMLKNGELFNATEKMYRKGIGTLAWQDSWNLFDQIILNRQWLTGSGWQYQAVKIFNAEFLRTRDGSFRGYPFRTFSGGIYTGGYSDHFASYIFITREHE